MLRGKRPSAVARRLGVTRQTVHAWLDRFNAGGLGADAKAALERLKDRDKD
jgi:transposase-like protein